MVKATVFFTCGQLFGALIHLNFIILILICFLFMMPSVNYLIYGCSSARTAPGVSLCWSLTLEEDIVAVITQDRVIDNSFKRQIKTQTLRKFFNILAIRQKYFSFYPIANFLMVNNFSVD